MKKIFLIFGFLLFAILNFPILFGDKAFTHDAIMWIGQYDYYIHAIKSGAFPYWDAFTQLGTPFYQNVHAPGLLDPIAFIGGLPTLLFNQPILVSYKVFYFLRLFIFIFGSFLIFQKMTRAHFASALAALALLFVVAPITYRQNGLMHSAYLTPMILYFWIRILESLRDQKKDIYIFSFLFTLLLGIVSAIYIPIFFAYSFFVFTIGLFVFQFFSPKVLLKLFQPKILPIFIISCVLILMFCVPSLTLMKETSGTGELFPILRATQSTGFVKIPENFFQERLFSFSANRGLNLFHGVYLTPANFMQYIFPGAWKTYPFETRHYSEIFIGLGALAFVLLAISLFTRRKEIYFLLFQLFFVVILGTGADLYGEPNWMQQTLIFIFPLLKTIDAYQLFGIQILFLSAFLLAFALKYFPAQLRLFGPIQRRIFIGLLILFFIGRIVFVYTKNTFGFHLEMEGVSSVLILIAIGFLCFRWPRRRQQILLTTMVLMTLELGYYNVNVNKFTLGPYQFSKYEDIRAEHEKLDPDLIHLFRCANWCTTSPYLSLFVREKGWLPKSYNEFPSSFFSTKRYYQFITEIPMSRQFDLVSMIEPLATFYGSEDVAFGDKHQIFQSLSKDSHPREKLYIEPSVATATPSVEHQPEDFEEVPWFVRKQYLKTLKEYSEIEERGTWDQERKNALEKMRQNKDKVVVQSEGPNHFFFQVQNSRAGYLYVNDGWSRYWKALVDGNTSPIHIANVNFKAVFLEAGSHDVQLIYDPYPYRYSLYSYYAALFLSALFAFIAYITCRKKADGAF